MSDLKMAQNDPEALLWRELGKVHAGMLGVEGSGQHLQPMAHHVDPEGRTLWFLTKRDTDLVQALHPDAKAHFAVIAKDQDFHACMSGPIGVRHDRAKLDEIWSPVSAAWFDGGKDDPDLVMLALDLRSAGIWASTGSTLAFAWQIAKANATGDTPDVGVHNVVEFA